MQAGWEKLGKDPAAAKAIIDNRFDYSIDAGKLLLVAGLLAFYFWYMLSVSAREYRDVIAERFDDSNASNGAARQARAQQR
jgi:F0F1-type ATP synthase membrane subunit b/b'